MKSLLVSSWFSQMHFIYFANRQANGQWSFRLCPPPRIFFSCVLFVFWTALSESTCRRLLLEQYFSFRVFCKFVTNWMIIHSSIFFFQKSIIWFHTIIILLYDCYDVTFCIWSLYSNYGKNEITKQINKTVTRLTKRSF